MQKYKLINLQTKEEHLCDKVTIDGFDYYVSDKCNDLGGWHIDVEFKLLSNPSRYNVVDEMREVIATNNPDIDIPKVVDNYKNAEWWAADLHGYDKNCELPINDVEVNSFIEGYNKCLETKGNSDEDVIEFLNWIGKDGYPCIDRTKKGLWVLHPQESKDFTPKELLQLWKEQQPKIVYYNE